MSYRSSGSNRHAEMVKRLHLEALLMFEDKPHAYKKTCRKHTQLMPQAKKVTTTVAGTKMD